MALKPKAKKRFVYKPRTVAQIQQRAVDTSDFDRLYIEGVNKVKLKDGKNRFRIMPQTWSDEPEHFGITIYIHRDVGADQGSYICREKMGWGPCPMCEERAALARAGADKDESDKLKPGRRVLVWLIDRDNEDAGPLLWDMPAGVDKEIAQKSEDPETGEVVNVEDPDDGNDVVIHKTGQSLQTRYGVTVIYRSSPLSKSEDKADKWVDYIVEHPLPDILKRYDYDYLAKVFHGHVEPKRRDAEDEPEEDEPRPRRGRAERSRVIEEDPEESQEEESFDPEDEGDPDETEAEVDEDGEEDPDEVEAEAEPEETKPNSGRSALRDRVRQMSGRRR